MIVGLAVSVGCGAARQGSQTNELTRNDVYLLIVNDGYDQIRVYDDFSRIATIMSGQSKCVKLRNPERNTQLSFSYLASNRRWYTPEQSFAGQPGWVWTINSRTPINSTIRMNVIEPCGGNSNKVEYYHR